MNVNARCFTHTDDGALLLPKKMYARAMRVINEKLLPLGETLNGIMQTVHDSDFVYTVEVVEQGVYKITSIRDIETGRDVSDIWEELIRETEKI